MCPHRLVQYIASKCLFLSFFRIVTLSYPTVAMALEVACYWDHLIVNFYEATPQKTWCRKSSMFCSLTTLSLQRLCTSLWKRKKPFWTGYLPLKQNQVALAIKANQHRNSCRPDKYDAAI